MTNLEKIKNFSESEMVEFLSSVSSGRFGDDMEFDFTGMVNIADCSSGFSAYDDEEYIRDYLRAEAV